MLFHKLVYNSSLFINFSSFHCYFPPSTLQYFCPNSAESAGSSKRCLATQTIYIQIFIVTDVKFIKNVREKLWMENKGCICDQLKITWHEW